MSGRGDSEDHSIRQLITLAAVLVTVVAALLALSAGVTVSSGLSGNGWRLPPASPTWAIRAVSGKPLDHWFTGYPTPVPQPGHQWVVWTVAGVLFAVLAVLAVAAAVWLRATLGPAADGMATGRDVDDALGLGALRRAGRQVRPDLHAPRPTGPYGEQPAPQRPETAGGPDPSQPGAAPPRWTPPGAWPGQQWGQQ